MCTPHSSSNAMVQPSTSNSSDASHFAVTGEEPFDFGVAHGLLILQRTNIGADERFDAVAESSGSLA